MKANIQQQSSGDNPSGSILELIIDSILDKKGERIVSLDLTNLGDAMSDHFVICEGNSPPQVKAIANNINFRLKNEMQEMPVHTEGLGTSEWVLVDYFGVVVHIFLKENRDLYRLEDLWGDAAIMTHYLPDGTSQVIEQLPKRGMVE